VRSRPAVGLFVRGHRQRAGGRRKSLPVTTCQRSARASCYGVRSRFAPRGRDIYSAQLQRQPSRSRLGRKTHQTSLYRSFRSISRRLRYRSSRHSDLYPKTRFHKWLSKKCRSLSKKIQLEQSLSSLFFPQLIIFKPRSAPKLFLRKARHATESNLAFLFQSIIQFEKQIENPAGYSLRILIACDRQGCRAIYPSFPFAGSKLRSSLMPAKTLRRSSYGTSSPFAY
jgi:hypothetical protein